VAQQPPSSRSECLPDAAAGSEGSAHVCSTCQLTGRISAKHEHQTQQRMRGAIQDPDVSPAEKGVGGLQPSRIHRSSNSVPHYPAKCLTSEVYTAASQHPRLPRPSFEDDSRHEPRARVHSAVPLWSIWTLPATDQDWRCSWVVTTCQSCGSFFRARSCSRWSVLRRSPRPEFSSSKARQRLHDRNERPLVGFCVVPRILPLYAHAPSMMNKRCLTDRGA
jgi:hypothetical protein